MTTIVRDIFVFVTAAIFVAAAVLITTGAGAHEFKVGAIDIGHPWSRPTPKDANIAGGYLIITNKGKTADRLIGGASPAAGQIEVHEVVDVDGMTKTRPLANGIEIKPGKTVELKPGALRIVLLGLKEPLPAWPEDQGHAGVRKGRARRDRLQRRGKSRSRGQWRRCCQCAAQAPLEHDPEKWVPVFPRDKRGTRLRGDHAQTIERGFACSGWEGLPALEHRIAFGRSSDAREMRRRPVSGVTRRTNSVGPSRSAMAGLEFIILQSGS